MRRKKTFACGHRGYGQKCHRCAQERVSLSCFQLLEPLEKSGILTPEEKSELAQILSYIAPGQKEFDSHQFDPQGQEILPDLRREVACGDVSPTQAAEKLLFLLDNQNLL